jgi:hypothetical protein
VADRNEGDRLPPRRLQVSVSAVMEHESRRSLFLFNAACDVLFVALATRIAASIPARPKAEIR